MRAKWLASIRAVAACAVLSACDEGNDRGTSDPVLSNLIVFSSLYSAFGGTQTYSVTPYAPVDAGASTDADPVYVSKNRWLADPSFLASEPFPSIDGAIKLTTKRAGTTNVSLTTTTVSGIRKRAESRLTIRAANDEDWRLGDERYVHEPVVDVDRPFDAGNGPADTSPICGVEPSTLPSLIGHAGCGSCHQDAQSAITPTQTAGYSDEQLIAIFTHGLKPEGYTFTSPLLQNLLQPDCVYTMVHVWALSDETKRGLVLKLRSLPPQAQAAADEAKAAEFGAAQRAPDSGAADGG